MMTLAATVARRRNIPGHLVLCKGETITRVNGDVSINCSKRLQI
jgi:hypothetical protein